MWPAIAFKSDIIPPEYRNFLLRHVFLLWIVVYKHKELPRLIVINDQPRRAHLN